MAKHSNASNKQKLIKQAHLLRQDGLEGMLSGILRLHCYRYMQSSHGKQYLGLALKFSALFQGFVHSLIKWLDKPIQIWDLHHQVVQVGAHKADAWIVLHRIMPDHRLDSSDAQSK